MLLMEDIITLELLGPGCGEEESFLMVNLLLMEVMLKGSWPLMNFSQIQTQRA
ncbi:hypothetical protein HanPI659440_Chr17g0679931 [Helianthus annuus]|nr:hypothetical protein HanPI659440_Chr17g0679931 [Helianthus annuus]